jgi:methyl-accepting chemotaxis protein
LNDTKCGLGKFLHGEEGKKLANSDPSLAKLLDAIKEPHQYLHESGTLIKNVWQQKHIGLLDLLKDRLDDHRIWASKIAEMVIGHNHNIHVQLDPKLCAFGRFLKSDAFTNYAKDFPAFRKAMDAANNPHAQLHGSAREIQILIQSGDYEKAGNIYQTVTLAKLQEVQKQFKSAMSAEGMLTKAQEEARNLFKTKTLPALQATIASA